jgi:hypothetical protein
VDCFTVFPGAMADKWFPLQLTTTMPGGVQSEVPQQFASKPAVHSCRRNITDRTSFVADLRDHVHEFLHASMDKHRTCLTTTIKDVWDEKGYC